MIYGRKHWNAPPYSGQLFIIYLNIVHFNVGIDIDIDINVYDEHKLIGYDLVSLSCEDR